MSDEHICPNCDIPLTYEYMDGLTENDERKWSPYYMCRICSFGYPVDWLED
jgi:hypothetical protein